MSDYDQLSEDEYDPELGDDSNGTFRIRDPLQPPHAQQWSTADLHGEFSLRPEILYQLLPVF